MDIRSHSIFDSECKFLVNTINTVGAMGRGLALEFRLRVPKMYTLYKRKCDLDEIEIGKYWVYRDSDRICKNILNFPTKRHFIHPSKPEYLEEGLQYFVNNYRKDGISSIAFPLLGSKNGKLGSKLSYEIIESYLGSLSIDIEICLGEDPDKFTKQMIYLISNMDSTYLSEKTTIPLMYCERLQSNLDKIHFLSEIVSEDIVPVHYAEALQFWF
jgi:hypothetical protein